MPIYEYRCENCGHEMDALQKLSDAPLVECPECGQPALQKLISAAAFRLKGGGWYETDFKQGNKKNLHDSGEKKEGGAASGAKKEKGSGETKKAGGESTPAAKPAAAGG
jgi:putative FmdB family regulatory protein